MARITWELLNTEEDDILLPEDDSQMSDFEKEEEEKYGDFGLQTKKMMNTPFGLAIVDNGMNPFKRMQLFAFHTDFHISAKIAETIEAVPGVEVLKILTPYRGVLSIGKIFDATSVRREITNKLTKKDIVHPVIREKVEELKGKLSQFNAWSIYVFPNGTADYCAVKPDNSNLEEYNTITELYREAVKYSNGVLIQSNTGETDNVVAK
jgi:hypothetical protein